MRKYSDYSKFYEEREKLPKPDGIHCIICGKKLPKYKRKYCSRKCFIDWIRPLILDWNEIRKRVLKRDNYTCQDCGFYDPDKYNLEVHHIIPIKDGGAEFDEDNCVTLCKNREDKKGCHEKRHRFLKHKCKSLKTFS